MTVDRLQVQGSGFKLLVPGIKNENVLQAKRSSLLNTKPPLKSLEEDSEENIISNSLFFNPFDFKKHRPESIRTAGNRIAKIPNINSHTSSETWMGKVNTI